jgi:hypothetical protein
MERSGLEVEDSERCVCLVSDAFESVIQSGMGSRTYGPRKRSGNGVLSVENGNSDGQVEPRIEEGEVRDAGGVESGLEQPNEQPYRDKGTWKQLDMFFEYGNDVKRALPRPLMKAWPIVRAPQENWEIS